VRSGGSTIHVKGVDQLLEQDDQPNDFSPRVENEGTQAEKELETRAEPQIDHRDRIPGMYAVVASDVTNI
jgi:hypothetical protein